MSKRKNKILYKVLKLGDLYLSFESNIGSHLTLTKSRRSHAEVFFKDNGFYSDEDGNDIQAVANELFKETGLQFRIVNIVKTVK